MSYQDVLHAVIVALVSLPVLGGGFTLAIALLMSPEVAAKCPRLVAGYRLACKVFPDLSDPGALAKDVMRVVLGTPLPALVLFLLWSAQGCASLRAAETAAKDAAPVVVQSAEEACKVVSLFTTDAVVHALCVTVDGAAKLEGELASAQTEARMAHVQIDGADGTSHVVHVAPRHHAMALASVRAAK